MSPEFWFWVSVLNVVIYKLFNKNNLKVSYCTTRNIQDIINTHNRRVLNKHNAVAVPRPKMCNCRAGVAACPVGGRCLEEGVVYEATVSAPGQETKTYIGSCSTTVKTRINNHHCDFRVRSREHATTLSSHVWKLKDMGADPAVSLWPTESRVKQNPTLPHRESVLCVLLRSCLLLKVTKTPPWIEGLKLPISVDTRQNLHSRLASDWDLNKRLDHHRIENFAHLFLILILSIVQPYFDAYLNVGVW